MTPKNVVMFDYISHRFKFVNLFSWKMEVSRVARSRWGLILFTCGVPQGSILGPPMVSLYLLLLGHAGKEYRVSFHCYADDIKLDIPPKCVSFHSLQPLFDCLEDIKGWMSSNFLALNVNKTLLMGTVMKRTNCSIIIIFLFCSWQNENLFALGPFFIHLRTLARAKPSCLLVIFWIHASITLCLSYNNSIVSRASHSHLYVHNAAAKLLTKTHKWDYMPHSPATYTF